MQFSSFALLSLLPFTMGIQTIYLGYIENSGQYVFPQHVDTPLKQPCSVHPRPAETLSLNLRL